MSHFTTLVVIRDADNAADAESQLDDLLEPFNENREVRPYPEIVSPGEVERAVAFYKEFPQHCNGEGGPTKPFDEFVTEGDLDAWQAWTLQAVAGYEGREPHEVTYDAEKDEYSYLTTYNPQSEWDWWQLGGRWHGSLKLKENVTAGAQRSPFPPIGTDRVQADLAIVTFDGGQQAILGPSGLGGDHPDTDLRGLADLARKGDIDIEGARDDAERQAREFFPKVEAACGPLPWPETKPLMHFIKDDFSNRDSGREEWVKQPLIKALQDAELIGWMTEPVSAYCLNAENPLEAFVRRSRQQVMSFYSVLVDGQWFSDSGWGEESDAWLAQANLIVDQLPDDAWLAVVDCHI